jgi:hypothetical protein
LTNIRVVVQILTFRRCKSTQLLQNTLIFEESRRLQLAIYCFWRYKNLYRVRLGKLVSETQLTDAIFEGLVDLPDAYLLLLDAFKDFLLDEIQSDHEDGCLKATWSHIQREYGLTRGESKEPIPYSPFNGRYQDQSLHHLLSCGPFLFKASHESTLDWEIEPPGLESNSQLWLTDPLKTILQRRGISKTGENKSVSPLLLSKGIVGRECELECCFLVHTKLTTDIFVGKKCWEVPKNIYPSPFYNITS